MYKIIKVDKKRWDGGSFSYNDFIGYFSVPKGWSLLEEAIAKFVAEYWNKALFYDVLDVYRPIGLGFPDNVSGLDIQVVELKEKPFNIANILDKDIRERLVKFYPNETKEINYDVGFKDSIFGILGTNKISSLEEGILTNPEYNFNYVFDALWKYNILLVELIKKTNIRPTWMDDYLKLMNLINSKTTFENFRKNKGKNVVYL